MDLLSFPSHNVFPHSGTHLSVTVMKSSGGGGGKKGSHQVAGSEGGGPLFTVHHNLS